MGFGLDFVALGVAPLLGFPMLREKIVPWLNLKSGGNAGQLLAYLLCVVGVTRGTCGLFPKERGAWYSCMASMLLETIWALHICGFNKDGMPAAILCGTTFLYMARNIPEAVKPKQ